MNTSQINSAKFLKSKTQINEYIAIKGECPKCHSYFVSEDECESCGFQINFDVVGNEFGPRSFFFMKEVFVENLTLIEGFLPQNLLNKLEKTLKYKRLIFKRYKELLGAWISYPASHDYITLECRHIVREYILLGGTGKELSLFLTDDMSSFTDIYNEIIKAEEERDAGNTKSSLISNELLFLLKFVSILALVSFAFYLVFLFLN